MEGGRVKLPSDGNRRTNHPLSQSASCSIELRVWDIGVGLLVDLERSALSFV
jgi:hypothetical protein